MASELEGLVVLAMTIVVGMMLGVSFVDLVRALNRDGDDPWE